MRLAFDMTGPVSVHTAPWADPLNKHEWIIRQIPHRDAVAFITKHHYAKGAANTSVARYGLYHQEGSELLGAILYMPPPGQAAKATDPHHPERVLALSRLAIAPEAPKNAASHLISRSVGLLPEKYETIATWADTARGHHGTIYQAANWRYRGMTTPQPMFRDHNGVMVSRKRGPKTYTINEMLELGHELVGRFARHKYILRRHDMHAHPDRPYPKPHPTLFQGGQT